MKLPKITTLNQAKAILAIAEKYAVAGFDEYGNVAFDGERYDGYYKFDLDNGEWCIAHYIYGGDYGRGTTPKAALLDFINKNPKLKEHVIELKKWRKKAALIVEKYS